MLWPVCEKKSEKRHSGKRHSAIFAAITISLLLFHVNNRTINYNCELKRIFQIEIKIMEQKCKKYR